MISFPMQLNPVAIEFAEAGFNILETVIRTGQVDLQKAIQNTEGEVQASIQKAKDCKDSHIKAAKSWGLACSKYVMSGSR